ncbi:MAG: DUF1326 domain-containing protein [Acidobacteriota bacterium]
MKRTTIFAALLVAAGAAGVPSSVSAGEKASLNGSYVEARTAEVFTGGCIMNSEAETTGKNAILAWNIDRGSYKDVQLDGLSVVAVLAGDRNLGMTEMGGAKASVRTAMFVDQRANPVQQMALVAMANDLSKGLLGKIVQVTPTPIAFTDHGGEVTVSASQLSLDVSKHVPHDPSCGAMQWFHPLSTLPDAELGLTSEHTFTGSALGTKWSDPNKRSAFFGSFSY